MTNLIEDALFRASFFMLLVKTKGGRIIYLNEHDFDPNLYSIATQADIDEYNTLIGRPTENSISFYYPIWLE